MSVRITTDIFCDMCADWHEGITSNLPKTTLTRKIIKTDGWRYIKYEGKWIDVCPECYKKIKGQS